MASSAVRSIACGAGTASASHEPRPTSTVSPSANTAITPRPGTSSNELGSASGTRARRPISVTARATGWRLFCSAAAASRKRSSAGTPSAGASRETASTPLVTVPVLSKTMAVRLRAASSVATLFTKTPSRAAADRAATIAVGVARIRALGQAITSMAIARLKAVSGSLLSAKKSTTPTSMRIVGVYQAAYWSTSRMMGVFVRSACRMRSFTRPRSVSAPAFVTATSIRPVRLMVLPNTSSPGAFSAGIDSPVMLAWFTVLAPRAITPSAGIVSPGRTRTVSPGESAVASTSSSRSPTMRLAFVGASRMSDSMLASAPAAVRRSMSEETIMKKATAAAS